MAPLRRRDAHLANGMRLNVVEAGAEDARLVLFVHGFPEFWYAWHEMLVEFGRDHHACAFDLRGFNLSDMPTAVDLYRPKHLVDDLRLLIAELGHERCVLVAHDWGGAVAWNLAAAMPDLVERLVIINSPHPATFQRELSRNPRQIAASAYMNFLRRPEAEAALLANDCERMLRFLAGVGQGTAWFDAATALRYKECWQRGLTGGLNLYRASPLHPATADEPGAAAVRFPPEAVTVRVPTLVIWGERDQALLPELLDGLEAYVPDLRVRRIPEGTHWVVHEYPREVSAMIREFIA
ncbi:MAG: alpha/beta fold hydrolase [Burkholderiales bacterium]|nr:alpha/beta fold hydrolase [Burkholderiales bacterium]